MKRILIDREGKKFFVSDSTRDYHCQFGILKANDMKKKSGIIKTNTGKEFYMFEPTFADLYARKRRSAQIVLKKDIGLIIAETGINKESIVVDAGGGSGALACSLANIAKEVITYEIREEFVKTINENISLLGLTNITVKNKSVSLISEKNVDLITLDLLEPVKVLTKCSKALKAGGFLIAYMPSVTQVVSFVKAVVKNKSLIYLKTVELIEREWKIEGKIARPEFRMLGHTGFLVFVRRV